MTDITIQPVTTEQWVNALRSGEYEQVSGGLVEADEEGCLGFCCLGVLAKIAGYPLDTTAYGDKTHYDGFNFLEHGRQGAVIPDGLMSTIVSDLDLAKNVEMPDTAGERCDLMRVVSSLNDRGANFNTIADYLESQVA